MIGEPKRVGETKLSRLLLITLLLVMALGAGLRLYRLGSESFWLDEAFSLQIADGPPAHIIEETAKDVHPPLYYFLLHYWMEMFGDSEFSSRLLSTLFGVLGILALYRLAEFLAGRAVGLLSAALLSLSHFHLEFSQETRMYTLLFLLSVVSMYFFLKLLAGERGFALAGYILSSALMTYTHVYSFFILAAQNLYFFSLPFAANDIFRRMWKRWLAAQIAVLVIFLPWLSVLLQQVSRVRQGFWIPRLPSRALLDTFILYAGSRQLAWILFPLAGLAIFLGLRGQREEDAKEAFAASENESIRAERLKTYLLLLWLVCPVLLPFVASEFTSPIFLPKYTIPASAAFVVLSARGLLSVRFHQLRMLLALLLVCFCVIDLRGYYSSVKKDTWREAVADFGKLARPGDLVLFNQQSGQSPFDYYARRTDLIEKPFPDYRSELRADNVAELLKSAVEGHDRVWLVVSHPGPITPLIAEQMEEWYRTRAHNVEPGVEMYLFERR